MAELVPPLIVEALRHGLPILDRRWHGRFLPEATLVGPEARGSAPVRIVRDDTTRETPGLEGLYPVGEGAGYAGGIVSAAVDGLRIGQGDHRHVRAAGVTLTPKCPSPHILLTLALPTRLAAPRDNVSKCSRAYWGGRF